MGDGTVRCHSFSGYSRGVKSGFLGELEENQILLTTIVGAEVVLFGNRHTICTEELQIQGFLGAVGVICNGDFKATIPVGCTGRGSGGELDGFAFILATQENRQPVDGSACSVQHLPANTHPVTTTSIDRARFNPGGRAAAQVVRWHRRWRVGWGGRPGWQDKARAGGCRRGWCLSRRRCKGRRWWLGKRRRPGGRQLVKRRRGGRRQHYCHRFGRRRQRVDGRIRVDENH